MRIYRLLGGALGHTIGLPNLTIGPRKVESTMAQIPQCSALILCDTVHKDTATGKHYILGTFNNVYAPKVPTLIQGTVYLTLTEVVGEVELTIQISHADELLEDSENPLPKCNVKITGTDPNDTIEVPFTFKLPFPRHGVYHLELVASDGTVIQAKRFTVAPQPRNQGE